ncbi:hypothetical protein ETD86_41770, partial [Nonomuraea turkmeniaca]
MPSAAAKAACSSGRCVLTPWTAAPAAANSAARSLNRRFSSVQPAAPGTWSQSGGRGAGTPVAGRCST